LCERVRYLAGRRWSDVECLYGVLKMHRAALRAISIGYRRALPPTLDVGESVFLI
jgi:hypothetical protein